MVRPTIDNTDVIPAALHDLGGAGTFIDVEDLFMRCYELAPERFGWRKFDLPNYKILSKALRDFEGKYPSLLIKTPDGLCRQLSAEGVAWLPRKMPAYRKHLLTQDRHPPHRRPAQRLLNELGSSHFVVQYSAGSNPVLSKYEASDLLLCSPDSPPSV